MRCDRLWSDARLVTCAGDGLGLIDRGVIAAREGAILYAGPASDAPPLDPAETIACDGRWITPGLIDCHTHLVHGGDRAAEFEARLAGASYEEIARAGGGILSTMRATRALDEDGLVAAALPRLDALIEEGVTTVEIKSGYGLEREAELRMLRAARRLGRERPVTVATTFLGAHALPPEFAGDPDGYVDAVCDDMLPAVTAEGLADAVDAFCEGIGFTPAQAGRVLAAGHGALSADHLEHVDDAGIAAMARAGTVATLLPGAYYFTRETRPPPVDALRAAGVPIALATDCNPGTSPLTSPLLVLNMAATLFRLTVEECLLGVTRNAARALGLARETGTLEAGKACDLAIWDVDRPAELVYRIGPNPLHARVWKGR